jgi:hypothetical protein
MEQTGLEFLIGVESNQAKASAARRVFNQLVSKAIAWGIAAGERWWC